MRLHSNLRPGWNQPIDEIDRKLVLELQRDGRASYAHLAGLVGMSQASVRARVQRLLSTGVVQIAAVADPYAFGFSVTALLGIRCTGDMDALGKAMEAVTSVHFVVLTAGRYDCLVEIVCVDNDDLFRLINDEVRSIPEVLEVDVITYLKMVKHWQPDYIRAGTPAVGDLGAPAADAASDE